MPDLSTLALIVVALQAAALPAVAVIGAVARATHATDPRLSGVTAGKVGTHLASATFAAPILLACGIALAVCYAADRVQARAAARRRRRARAWLLRNGGL